MSMSPEWKAKVLLAFDESKELHIVSRDEIANRLTKLPSDSPGGYLYFLKDQHKQLEVSVLSWYRSNTGDNVYLAPKPGEVNEAFYSGFRDIDPGLIMEA